MVNYCHDSWFNRLSNLYRNKLSPANPLLSNYCTSCAVCWSPLMHWWQRVTEAFSFFTQFSTQYLSSHSNSCSVWPETFFLFISDNSYNPQSHIIVTKSRAVASGGFVSIFRHNNKEKCTDFKGINSAKSVNCSYVITTMFLLVTAGISRYKVVCKGRL